MSQTDEVISFELPVNDVEWLVQRGGLVGTLTKTFFDKYCYRGLNELALMGVPWSEKKKQLVDTFKVRHPNTYA